jgi:hypothetical protein
MRWRMPKGDVSGVFFENIAVCSKQMLNEEDAIIEYLREHRRTRIQKRGSRVWQAMARKVVGSKTGPGKAKTGLSFG